MISRPRSVSIMCCIGAALAMSGAAGCSVGGGPSSQSGASSFAPAGQTAPARPRAAQQEFWRSLESLCGKAYEGRVVLDSTGSPDFAGKRLVMHVRRCEQGRILVPFHVGEDRSRTWVFTVTDTGLRLKHDHRHEDGSEDELTQYGGDTREPGAATEQSFHADDATAVMLPAAATNIWTVEIIPGRTYSYALRREGTDRKFRVEFDLTRPVEPPPAPWGAAD